ncbi:hypothetical protein ACEPUD_24550 [Burkholderia ubonensis]|uniref:hypothetical protein n=1 Tax=Burkholderia ubonensis TaxID=101571 RepID=UPI00358FE53E
MTKLPFTTAVLILLSACTSTEEAAQWMKGHPVHDVKVGGYAFFACSWNSRVGRYYSAVDDKSGERVQGTICTNLDNNASDVTEDKRPN